MITNVNITMITRLSLQSGWDETNLLGRENFEHHCDIIVHNTMIILVIIIVVTNHKILKFSNLPGLLSKNWKMNV